MAALEEEMQCAGSKCNSEAGLNTRLIHEFVVGSQLIENLINLYKVACDVSDFET